MSQHGIEMRPVKQRTLYGQRADRRIPWRLARVVEAKHTRLAQPRATTCLYGRALVGSLSTGTRGTVAFFRGRPRPSFCQLHSVCISGSFRRRLQTTRAPKRTAKACFLSCPQREPGNYRQRSKGKERGGEVGGVSSTRDKTFNALSKQPGKSLFSSVQALLFNSEL